MKEELNSKSVDLTGSVVFTTVVKTPEQSANSTHIMTTNIIRGLKQAGRKICMLTILEDEADREGISQYFQPLVDEIVFLPSHCTKKLRKSYEHLLRVVGTMALPNYYQKYLSQYSFIGEPELIISNAPTLESVLCGEAMKKKFPDVEYYQYWSDPITLSGITPEAYTLKRFLHRWAEAQAIKKADKVIYGTKTLMDFQKRMFKKFSDKMRYIDVSYVESGDKHSLQGHPNKILYAGNFQKNIRNIQPLVDALAELPEYHLDIFGVGECEAKSANVCLHGRVTPRELSNVELEYGVNICILNHSCIQIPGKIFYSMNNPGVIVVISDGPYTASIIDYLSSYGRFVVCENNSDAIKENLLQLAHNTDLFENFDLERYSPKKIARDLVAGGHGGQ